MTDKLKKFFRECIQLLRNNGLDNPVEMLSPLLRQINQNRMLQKFLGHLNTCEEYLISYNNESGGYTNGSITIEFRFKSTKAKIYVLSFNSILYGSYPMDDNNPNTEWWKPVIDITMIQNIGELSWSGSEKTCLEFQDKIMKEIGGNGEIIKLKQEIAEKQRELAKLERKVS